MEKSENVGHIVKGQLHEECEADHGCGEKYEVKGTGQIVELERDEAVIIPEAFEDRCFNDSFCKSPTHYKMTGTIAQIASAINQLGGGANFKSGAKVWKNGRIMNQPRMTVRNARRNPPKLEGGSVVINRTNMLNPEVMTFEGTAYEIASQINSYGGNGVSLMEDGGRLDMGMQMKSGGKITDQEKTSLYSEWKKYVNMTLNELRKFYDSDEGKEAGLSKKEADDLGIGSGRESARWIMNMKQTPEHEWTPKYWDWAKRQVGFIKRMRGNKGDLYDENGKKTRKHTSLLIWGHNPEKFNAGGAVETKYIGEADFNIWASSDKEAKAKAQAVVDQIDSENRPDLIHLYRNPAPMMVEKLFKEGGEIEYTEKQINKIVEKTAKRQKEYAELLRKERKKQNKNTLPAEISTMVSSPLDKSTLRDDQRQKLVDWALDPENNVKFIVAFSGGKDSVAMVLRLLYDYQVPPSQIELWHHEVDGFGENLWDWKCTPSYCQAFADYFEIPLLFSYREGGITAEILKGKDEPQRSKDIFFQTEPNGEFIRSQSSGELTQRMMFPAIVADLQTRWCSSMVKIDVMSRAINNSPHLKSGGQAIICTGERRLESGNRAQYLEIEPYSFGYDKSMITWRPVIDMTEQEVWDMYEMYGIQPHPSYELGWGRCSCQTCIFNGKNQWATIQEISPEKIDLIAELEKITGSTLHNEDIKEEKWIPPHSKTDSKGKTRNYKGKFAMVSTGKKKTIRDKVAEGKSFLTPEAKKRWMHEALNEFVSPIYVEAGKWRLPDGAFKGEDCGAN